MMNRKRAVRRDGSARRGQSLVELALLLPLLALIMLGTIDLGRAFFAYTRLTNAVKEGAIFGIDNAKYVTDSSVNDGFHSSADPNNIIYWVKQESADPNLTINAPNNSNSDVLCYQGRSTTLVAASDPFAAGNCRNARPGDTIQVRATYAFQPLTLQLAGNVGSPLLMRATVRMVIVSPGE